MVPGRGVLEERGEVLPYAPVLGVVGGVWLRLRRQDLDRGEFKRVGGRRLGRRGERQLVVVVVVCVVVMVVAQAGLHVPGELHLGYREGHLVRAEGRTGRYVVAPQLEHARGGADGALVGKLGAFGAYGASDLPGLATGGGQERQGAGRSLRRGAGRPILCREAETHTWSRWC